MRSSLLSSVSQKIESIQNDVAIFRDIKIEYGPNSVHVYRGIGGDGLIIYEGPFVFYLSLPPNVESMKMKDSSSIKISGPFHQVSLSGSEEQLPYPTLTSKFSRGI